MGYHQMDEHFMILEFSKYKFGQAPSNIIPWEFSEKIRPTLQPSFAHFFFELCKTLGLKDPFVQVFFLRLISGLLACWVIFKTILVVLPNLKQQSVRRISAAVLCLFWFMPYLDVRFSSENMAGLSFMASLLFIPDIFKAQKFNASFKSLFGLGFGLACSFYFRFQIAFSIIGVLLWLLWYLNSKFKSYFYIFIGAVTAVFFQLLIDRWFYGDWVLSPLRYYQANIVRDAASTYGISPWYEYISLFLSQGIPPFSIVLILLFGIALIKKPQQLMVYAFIPFFIGHSMVPHKEFRFLYPMVIPFLLICANGLDLIWTKVADKKWFVITGKLLIILNIFLLLYRITWPAKNNHFYYKYLYHYAEKAKAPIHLLNLGRGIYDEGYNEIMIYRHPLILEDTIKANEFNPYLSSKQPDSILVLSYQPTLPLTDTNYQATRLYTYLPDWIINISFNDWQSRSDIWSIWKLKKKS